MTLVAVGLLVPEFTPVRLAAAVIALTPLALGLRRLLAEDRRAYAWMTLVVVPYLALALTEVIANPGARGLSGAGLLAAFLLFVVLICYLRVTGRD